MSANSTYDDQTASQPDPFASVADAMRDAIHTASEDASKARGRLRSAGPDVMRSLARFTYIHVYQLL
ncbi:hypothetical protein [Candidatus Methylocalor cossyra]|uniref:Uncharacterized protein n=1 Tax=Candidatus Methylocalor cossyra TaxID=3108543 RepID=A0ABM9NE03_9GAMM